MATLSLLALALSGSWSRAWAWPASDLGRAAALAVDASGNVVVGSGDVFQVVKRAAADGRALWRHEGPGFPSQAVAVVVDAGGDVIAAGRIGGAFAVVKLAGATGATLWTALLQGTESNSACHASAVALDAAGDVLAAGQMVETGTGANFAVVKLAGADGSETWRRAIAGTLGASAAPSNEALAVAVDATGDVAAAGRLVNVGPKRNFAVVKLSGADGSETWRRNVATPDGAFDDGRAVAFDANGDVLATGEMQGRPQLLVIKLAATDGTELWRYAPEIYGIGTALAVDAADDVVAVGSIDGVGTVVKLASGTGAEVWRTAAIGPGLNSVALTAAGDVATTGNSFPSALTALELDGATGSQMWRFDLDRVGGRESIENVAVAVAPSGDVAVLGTVDFQQSIVARLAGASGTLVGCGGGTFDPGELCDDGNLAPGDGCDAGCRLEPSAADCRDALASTGFDYFRRRLGALHKCRHRIDAGQLAIAPSACPADPAAAKTIGVAAGKARARIATLCTDALVASLGACATTVDGLVTPAADGGCFLANHAAAADAAASAEFPRVLAPEELDERRCQRASAKAALSYTRSSAKQLQRCLDLELRLPANAAILYHGACRHDARFSIPIERAATKTDEKIGASCPPAVVTSIGGCVGCAVETSDTAVDAILAEEYGL
ncbi:MAG TPA: hypothetical protein VKA21_08750 [Candidatus Binatia bacterium]|nr:hypothetical protein [Candidatus Binatia bacterium]